MKTLVLCWVIATALGSASWRLQNDLYARRRWAEQKTYQATPTEIRFDRERFRLVHHRREGLDFACSSSWSGLTDSWDSLKPEFVENFEGGVRGGMAIRPAAPGVDLDGLARGVVEEARSRLATEGGVLRSTSTTATTFCAQPGRRIEMVFDYPELRPVQCITTLTTAGGKEYRLDLATLQDAYRVPAFRAMLEESIASVRIKPVEERTTKLPMPDAELDAMLAEASANMETLGHGGWPFTSGWGSTIRYPAGWKRNVSETTTERILYLSSSKDLVTGSLKSRILVGRTTLAELVTHENSMNRISPYGRRETAVLEDAACQVGGQPARRLVFTGAYHADVDKLMRRQVTYFILAGEMEHTFTLIFPEVIAAKVQPLAEAMAASITLP